MPGWPDEAVLWESAAVTLEEQIVPALTGPAQGVARQLSGLARYAMTRGEDPTPARARELAVALGIPSGQAWSVVAAAASATLSSDRAWESGDPTAAAVRGLLLRFVGEDMERSAPLAETFARHGVTQVGEETSSPEEAGALKEWLGPRLGTPIRAVQAHVMSGGHSRRMLDVRVDTGDDVVALVVRVEQGGVFGTDGGSEARIMTALHAAGVPVAEVRWVEDTGKVLGHPFFVMARVEGSHDVDEDALVVFGRALQDLHRLPVDSVAPAFAVVPASPEEGVEAAIDHWEGVYRRAAPDPVPLLEDAAAWLRRHLRPTGPLAVVHGDAGPGNFLHRDGRLAAFTDWEFGHLGDPAEDWVYLAAMRATRIKSLAEWKVWLRERVGVSYDERTWRDWTVFNLFKGACANITALRVFEDRSSLGPNLLAVGTALHWRMIRQIQETITA